MTITTKYGTFNVVNNGNGGTMLFVGDVKICEFPKVAWWDSDGIINAVNQHHDTIAKRKEQINKITRENAPEVISRLIEVFGNENKGFFASRLKQCLNRLV